MTRTPLNGCGTRSWRPSPTHKAWPWPERSVSKHGAQTGGLLGGGPACAAPPSMATPSAICPPPNVPRFCQIPGVLSPDPERSEDSVRRGHPGSALPAPSEKARQKVHCLLEPGLASLAEEPSGRAVWCPYVCCGKWCGWGGGAWGQGWGDGVLSPMPPFSGI